MKSLNNIADKSPFKVPDNYFEEINNKIISSIPETTREIRYPVKVRSLRTYLMVAASVAGLIILGYTTMRLLSSEKETIHAAAFSQEEFQNPLFTELDILTLEGNAADMMLADDGPDVNKTDIIEYLLLENIEISDIYEQL